MNRPNCVLFLGHIWLLPVENNVPKQDHDHIKPFVTLLNVERKYGPMNYQTYNNYKLILVHEDVN